MEPWERAAYRAVYQWRRHDLYEDLHSAARFGAWLRRDDADDVMYMGARSAATDEARRLLGRREHWATRKPSKRYLLNRATRSQDPFVMAHGDPDGEVTGRVQSVPEPLRQEGADPCPWSEQLGLFGRDALLVEWLLEGRTYRWMADQLGVTEGRVTQLFHEMRRRVNRADLLPA